jgi:cysteine synthase
MSKTNLNIEKLSYKGINIPKLTRGIANDLTETIGNTPLVRLNRVN